MEDLYNKIKTLKQTPREYKIYTYHFPDGKIYVGYTHGSLEERHNLHKNYSISPIYNRLNDKKINTKPKYEKTVMITLNSDEIYKYQRKILDTYTTDTKQILNKNLKLLGY